MIPCWCLSNIWPNTAPLGDKNAFEIWVTLKLSYDRIFRVTGHFETIAPNDLKIAFNTKRSKVTTYIFFKHSVTPYAPLSPNFIVSLMTSRFQVTGQFETSVLNDHKMILNNKMSKQTHKLNNSTTVSQIPLRFCSTASRFRVIGHFQTSAPNMTPKWLWSLKAKGTPYTYYN